MKFLYGYFKHAFQKLNYYQIPVQVRNSRSTYNFTFMLKYLDL